MTDFAVFPPTTTIPESFTFPEQKISNASTPETQELYLFQWLSCLEKDLQKSGKVLKKTT